MKIPLQAALARVPGPLGERFAEAFEHGSLSLEVYAPRGVDTQSAHARDELYLVVRGSGHFVCGAEREPFAAGDALFAPAGAVHRFEEFTDDLCVWVVFYGAVGGEKPRTFRLLGREESA